MNAIETYPFRSFVPLNSKYLILGCFVAKSSDLSYDRFYTTKRNQFCPILKKVYEKELRSKSSKKALFRNLGIAIADIINKCERVGGNSADTNLKNIE